VADRLAADTDSRHCDATAHCGEKMTRQSQFFREQRPAAVLKHGILRRYLHVFASKTGSTAPGRRVAYLDGYSGPGEYEDGTRGSPLLAAETARLLGNVRNLEGFYVEKDLETYRQLRDSLARTNHRFKTYRGSVEDHLPTIMGEIGDAPLFTFFDPFGLGVPFDMLDQHIFSRKRGQFGPATEILLNFSLPGLRRNAGHLTSTSTDSIYRKARATIIERVDRTLGGDWWHAIWEAGDGNREAAIVSGYVKRLRDAAGGWAYASIPVQNRWQGPPVYGLIFLTSYQGGLWAFNEALSNAMEEFRGKAHELHGMLDLDLSADRETQWVDQVAANVERYLDEHGPFIIVNHMEVYGDTFGFAREKHVRAALKKLCAEGRIRTEVWDKGKLKTDGKGPVEKMRVLPPT
jgi:three-Cys-motif partner protein